MTARWFIETPQQLVQLLESRKSAAINGLSPATTQRDRARRQGHVDGLDQAIHFVKQFILTQPVPTQFGWSVHQLSNGQYQAVIYGTSGQGTVDQKTFESQDQADFWANIAIEDLTRKATQP